MVEWTIRKAGIRDLDDLVDLHFELTAFIQECNVLVWKTPEVTRSEIRTRYEDYIENDDKFVYIALEGAAVIGFISGAFSIFKVKPSRIAQIYQLLVREANRRRGLGRRLVTKLMEDFKNCEAEQIQLRYVDGNKLAERFWKDLGFKDVIHVASLNVMP